MWTTNEERHKNNPYDKKRSPKEKEMEHWNVMEVKREKNERFNMNANYSRNPKGVQNLHWLSLIISSARIMKPKRRENPTRTQIRTWTRSYPTQMQIEVWASESDTNINVIIRMTIRRRIQTWPDPTRTRIGTKASNSNTNHFEK